MFNFILFFMAGSLFSKAPVEIPNRSGFDMSHENFFTANCGTLTPCMVDYLLPNDTVSVGFNAQIQLPPMATDFYGEIVGKYELFFVPYRILFGGWKQIIAPYDGVDSSVSFPYVSLGETEADFFKHCYLLDYLGLNPVDDLSSFVFDTAQTYGLNLFPVLAYHKIYDDWYRDSRITQPCFSPSTTSGGNLQTLPWVDSTVSLSYNASFYNGHKLFDMWQRNWPKDYFTNCTTMPEAGDPASLTFKVDDGEGSFTIAGLRAANSLQMFMERNNMAGNRYQDRIRVHYGIYPSDAVTDKALYLGSGVVNVYTKSIFQSAGGSSSSSNPFDTVASKYGSSQGVGGGSLCKKFTASEHGILMCIFSLVPRRYYSSGARRQMLFYYPTSIPYPSLAGVGDQEVYKWELAFNGNPDMSVFGYTQRYAEYKFMNNEVHGLLRDGESLASFALQTHYDFDKVSLDTSFIQIPTDYLDQVSAVAGDVSKYGCWNDTYFSYKKVSTLPAYSIPTLENMKHSHTENIPLGGTRL